MFIATFKATFGPAPGKRRKPDCLPILYEWPSSGVFSIVAIPPFGRSVPPDFRAADVILRVRPLAGLLDLPVAEHRRENRYRIHDHARNRTDTACCEIQV
jgi:hypothetical protein